MWSCMPGCLREVVLSFKFRQNRLNGFRDVGGQNLPFPILKAYITACTTVQAVIISTNLELINLLRIFSQHFIDAEVWYSRV